MPPKLFRRRNRGLYHLAERGLDHALDIAFDFFGRFVTSVPREVVSADMDNSRLQSDHVRTGANQNLREPWPEIRVVLDERLTGPALSN
jgi:hypothetical protein